jgi:DNA polymerase (family 10)
LDGIEEVIGSGETKTSVRLKGGIACDLRLVTDEQFPFTLAHFTGSKEHNVAMRGRAQRLFNIRVSEYGLFDESADDALIECGDEAAIHERLGLAFIEPELREDGGEIAAAEADELPKLVAERDLVGVLHMHTTYSDGKESVATMARAAADMDFEWIGITDHSVSAFYAGGMKPDDVRRQFDEIDALNAGDSPVTIFKGIEVDILPDGGVDYDESIWKRTDFMIASVHSQFGMPEKEMTHRICRALENPWVTILGHPTGRLLLSREPYAVDLEAVIEAAAKHGRMIEINANPRRLDLDWRWVRRARDAGITIPIGPDAHNVPMLRDVWVGVGIARKGWLAKGDVLNCRSATQVKRTFAATRR